VLEHLRFRAGYDFMLLRVEAGELPQQLGEWWTAFVEADPIGREALLNDAAAESRTGTGTGTGRKRRRRGGARRSRAAAEGDTSAPEQESSSAAGSDSPAGGSS
jgi:poly(A) polymerase